MADAAKSAFEGIFNKTKDLASAAADATKGLASQATQAVGKIIPGHNNVDPNAVPAEGAPANGSADPNAAPSMQ
ncbi:hypothetical protein PRIPAC_74903 [Pristionchus pacificus]|uniref:Uncharacterized protein n=1 Tax=Pristionchus pacificus TaxID=54126 RepID=A0A2A6CR64_PRIPA|nr:hypothetical protein PRIPAC_74903 [Pristionchus pacificus]|eukprot:PDM80610.1 hypothetical protein PRIPAC_35613 [Pristionchus pacificus]